MGKVAEHLKARGIAFELLPHDRTYTSIEEAGALGISADEVVKTVAVKTARGYVLAVVPGSDRVDMKRVRQAAEDPHARLATEEELERDFPDHELGGLPPLGSLLEARVLVDPKVMGHDTVLFAGGSTTESIKVQTQELFRIEPHTVVDLTRHEPEDAGTGPAPAAG